MRPAFATRPMTPDPGFDRREVVVEDRGPSPAVKRASPLTLLPGFEPLGALDAGLRRAEAVGDHLVGEQLARCGP